MKKNRILLVLIVLIGIFAFNYDVKADWIAGYGQGKIEFNIYNDETKQFEKENIITMYLETKEGILKPYNIELKQDDEVYVIDEKAILNVPQKDGYYFSGWYLDENYEKSFLTYKFDKSFEELDLKLYGKWVKENPNNKTYKFNKDVYIVSYYDGCSNWMDGCSCSGMYIYMPSNKYMTSETKKLDSLPVLKDDNDFLGWYDGFYYTYYNDVKFSDNKINSFDDLVSISINGYISLHANWKSYSNNSESRKRITEEMHSVNHSTGKIKYNILNEKNNEFEEIDMKNIYLSNGNGVMIPWESKNKNAIVVDDKYVIAIPEKDGYYFDGWYLDKELKKEFKDNALEKKDSLENSDFNLYGKWTKEKIDKKTYKIGEDLFIVELMTTYGLRSASDYKQYGSYIYIKGNNYLTNEKGKITTLPTDIADKTNEKNNSVTIFDGWHSGGLKIDNNLKNIDEIEGYNGFLPISVQWITEHKDLNSEKEDIAPPIVPSERKEDSNMKYLYIALASGGIALVLLIAAFAVNNKKSKKVVKQEIPTPVEENKDIESKE